MEVVNKTSESRSGHCHWVKTKEFLTEQVALSVILKITQAITEPCEACLER